MATIDTYSVTVAASDISGIVASLPADMQGPDGGLIYTPNPKDPTTGVASVNVARKADLDNAIAMDPSQRLKTVLLAYAANSRWQLQNSGVTINSIGVATTNDSLTLMNGAVALLNQDPTIASINFKASTGYVLMPRVEVVAIGVAVAMFYQACFTAEAAVEAKINSSTYTSESQIDNAVEWPSTTIILPTTTGATGATGASGS